MSGLNQFAQHEQKKDAAQDAAQSDKPKSPAMKMVEMALMVEDEGPDQIIRLGKIISAHPQWRNEIMAFLHQTKGNAFASQVAVQVQDPNAAVGAPPKLSAKERHELNQNIEGSDKIGSDAASPDKSSSKAPAKQNAPDDRKPIDPYADASVAAKPAGPESKPNPYDGPAPAGPAPVEYVPGTKIIKGHIYNRPAKGDEILAEMKQEDADEKAKAGAAKPKADQAAGGAAPVEYVPGTNIIKGHIYNRPSNGDQMIADMKREDAEEKEKSGAAKPKADQAAGGAAPVEYVPGTNIIKGHIYNRPAKGDEILAEMKQEDADEKAKSGAAKPKVAETNPVFSASAQITKPKVEREDLLTSPDKGKEAPNAAAPQEKGVSAQLDKLYDMIGAGITDKAAYGALLMEAEGAVRGQMSAALGRAFGPQFPMDAIRVFGGGEEQYKPAVGKAPVMSAEERKKLNDMTVDAGGVPAPVEPAKQAVPDERKPIDPYADASGPAKSAVAQHEAAHQHPATKQVQAMLDAGDLRTGAIAKIVHNNPAARVAILALLRGKLSLQQLERVEMISEIEDSPPVPIAAAPAPVEPAKQASPESKPNPYIDVATPKVTEQKTEIAASVEVKQQHVDEKQLSGKDAAETQVEMGPMRITASSLRVRTEGDTSTKKNIIGHLKHGAIVTPVGKSGAWWEISYHGTTAYIHGAYTVSATNGKQHVKDDGSGENAEPDAEHAQVAKAAEANATPPMPAPAPKADKPQQVEGTPVEKPPAPAPAPAPVSVPGQAPAAAHPMAPLPNMMQQDPVGGPQANMSPWGGFGTDEVSITSQIPKPATTSAPNNDKQDKQAAEGKDVPLVNPDMWKLPVTPQLPMCKVGEPDPVMQPQQPATNVAGPAPVDQPKDAGKPELTGKYEGMFSHVYDTGSQKVQVFVSPGGVSHSPNVYLHFHGYFADYGIDENLKWDDKSQGKGSKTSKSGIDQAKEAMAQAQQANTIAILPQGVLGKAPKSKGDRAHEGGFMADIADEGLPTFLGNIMKPLGKDIGVDPLSAGHIGIGGHSAGGYQGIHQALTNAGDMYDQITDVTLMDSSYSTVHFKDTAKWMAQGKAGKTVRVVNSYHQGKGDEESVDRWKQYFGPAGLSSLAKAHGFTVNHLSDGDGKKGKKGEKVDNDTHVMQHSQLINKEGQVHCDIQVMMFSIASGNDHEPLRDRVIDDAMLNVGKGSQGNEDFGYYDKGKLQAHGTGHDEKAASTVPGAVPEKRDPVKEAGAADKEKAPSANDAYDPNVHVLPTPEHDPAGPSDQPETVKAPPAVAANGGKDSKETKKKKALPDAELREQLYGKGGVINRDLLETHCVTKGRHGEPVEFDLTAAQYDFKQRCYDAATARIGKGKLYGGVSEHELAPVGSSGERMRPEAAGKLESMMTKMNSELKAEHGPHNSVVAGSCYRPPKEDFGLWDQAFDSIYLWHTQAARREKYPDNEFCDGAIQIVLEYIKNRKAAPGTSHHTNGMAVDLHIVWNGTPHGASFDHQEMWRASPHYAWLKQNAKHFGFKNFSKEAWHYDFEG